jgi:hypothetical protein
MKDNCFSDMGLKPQGGDNKTCIPKYEPNIIRGEEIIISPMEIRF